MFAGRFSSSTGVIGIDFGSRGMKVLQLREKADRLHVVGAAWLDVPLLAVASPPGPASLAPSAPSDAAKPAMPECAANSAAAELFVDQLRAAFGSSGFAGRRCVVSLARSDVFVQSIRLPKMPDDELRQTARWEASQRFNLDRQAMEADFIRTGAVLQTGETREEVMIIAASHATIHARLDPILAAGLRPVAVDTTFTALARALGRRSRRQSDRDVIRAVVEVGYSGSTVLILRGDQIAFCKPIQIGGKDFNQAVAEHLQLELSAATELRAARIANRSAKLKLQHNDSPDRAMSCASKGPHSQSIANGNPDQGSSGRIEPVAWDPSRDGPRLGTLDSATDRAVYEAVRPLMGELVKEVTLCLRYYGVTFRGQPPEHIILTGGDGLEARLGETMATSCKTPVMFDDAAGTLSSIAGPLRACLNRTPGPAACWAVAAGLSLRGLRHAVRNDRPQFDVPSPQPTVINPERPALSRGLAA